MAASLLSKRSRALWVGAQPKVHAAGGAPGHEVQDAGASQRSSSASPVQEPTASVYSKKPPGGAPPVAGATAAAAPATGTAPPPPRVFRARPFKAPAIARAAAPAPARPTAAAARTEAAASSGGEGDSWAPDPAAKRARAAAPLPDITPPQLSPVPHHLRPASPGAAAAGRLASVVGSSAGVGRGSSFHVPRTAAGGAGSDQAAPPARAAPSGARPRINLPALLKKQPPAAATGYAAGGRAAAGAPAAVPMSAVSTAPAGGAARAPAAPAAPGTEPTQRSPAAAAGGGLQLGAKELGTPAEAAPALPPAPAQPGRPAPAAGSAEPAAAPSAEVVSPDPAAGSGPTPFMQPLTLPPAASLAPLDSLLADWEAPRVDMGRVPKMAAPAPPLPPQRLLVTAAVGVSMKALLRPGKPPIAAAREGSGTALLARVCANAAAAAAAVAPAAAGQECEQQAPPPGPRLPSSSTALGAGRHARSVQVMASGGAGSVGGGISGGGGGADLAQLVAEDVLGSCRLSLAFLQAITSK